MKWMIIFEKEYDQNAFRAKVKNDKVHKIIMIALERTRNLLVYVKVGKIKWK